VLRCRVVPDTLHSSESDHDVSGMLDVIRMLVESQV
jgi:hypothetical protein